MSGFLKQFMSSPVAVGAIAPSSARLATRMVEWIDWDGVNAVVEYGPGTGAFTGHVVDALNPSACYFGIELNADFFETLQQRFPEQRFYNDSVENVEALCAGENVDSVDAIVCGLPWAAFSESMQTAYLDSMLRVLRPGGQFVTFAYLQGLMLPAGQRFRKTLNQTFDSVEQSPTVWRNMPPAFVYRCRKG
ncbi:MAG: methyltransferase domain-containing protein [Candidatus Hydrogenedentota bacterium]